MCPLQCTRNISVVLLTTALVSLVTGQTSQSDSFTCYPDLPDPELAYVGQEDYTTSMGEYTRYWLSVANWEAFPEALFEQAPDLPPCGSNPNASRTWVDIYDADDNALNGFCGFTCAEDLAGLWFALPKGTTPPECVYVTLTDRRCGLIYTSVCTLVSIPVDVDIKPGSCPNPLNVTENGVLPVAILGTAEFDVFTLDLTSIRLAGVAPIRSSYEDVSTPVLDAEDDCVCTTDGADGFVDLTLKFSSQEIVAALGPVSDSDQVPLTLTAQTLDGTSIVGTDCVIVLAKGGYCPEPLVINGDFEVPVVTTSEGWDVFPSGTAGLGWTVEWAEPCPEAPPVAALELQRGVSGWTSYDGAQHAELDSDWSGPYGDFGWPASVRIYQDICTQPGRTYTLSYAWSPRPGHDNNVLAVYWNDSMLAMHEGSGNSSPEWTVVTFSALEGAAPPAKKTRLEFVEAGTADSWGMFLDGVSVTEEKGKQGKK